MGSLLARLVCILAVLALVASSAPNYRKFLEEECLDEKLELLQLKNLLKDHEGNESSLCDRDLLLFKEAIERRESWALGMLDASTKIPVSLLQGNIIDLGDYDECIKAQTDKIPSHHCTYTISYSSEIAKIGLNPRLSICVPSSCVSEDVIALVNNTIIKNQRFREFGTNVTSAICTTNEPMILDGIAIVLKMVTVIYILFIITCTVCDVANQRTGSLGTLSQFSMLRNAKATLSTKLKENDIPVIHGIRALSTTMLILLHEYFARLIGANVNPLDLVKWFSSWNSLIALVGLYSVDTFLTLSGFLMTYSFMKQRQAGMKTNILTYYLHRYLRLTLPIASLLAMTYFILPLIGSGPLFNRIFSFFITSCRTKWWTVLLYLHTFIDKHNYCLIHTWSIAVDMQLYWLSPIILIPLYKKPKLGLTILSILLLGTTITIAWITAANKFSAIYFTHDIDIMFILDEFRVIYIMVYTRAGPWLVGVFFGYIVTNMSNKPSMKLLFLGWLLTVFAFAFCIIGMKSFTDTEYDYNLIRELIFACLSKLFWSFGVCWIIYASYYESAGLISNVLSWKIFVPLSKLSYAMNITHVGIPMLYTATLRQPRYFSDYSVLHSFVSNYGLAIIIAFIFNIIFEVPMQTLDKMIFKNDKPAVKNTKKVEDKNE